MLFTIVHFEWIWRVVLDADRPVVVALVEELLVEVAELWLPSATRWTGASPTRSPIEIVVSQPMITS